MADIYNTSQISSSKNHQNIFKDNYSDANNSSAFSFSKYNLTDLLILLIVVSATVFINNYILAKW